MDKTFTIQPHSGIGNILLGMRRNKVRELAGTPHSHDHKKDYYWNCGFQIFYDADDKVEYIELSRDSGFRAEVFGLDPFQTPGSELIEEIKKKYPYDPEDPELGYSYVFKDLDLSFWRPTLPEGPNDNEGLCFSTVGIGIKCYYS